MDQEDQADQEEEEEARSRVLGVGRGTDDGEQADGDRAGHVQSRQ